MSRELYVLLKKSLSNNVTVVGIFDYSEILQKRNEMIGFDSTYIYEIQGPFNVKDEVKPLFPEIYNPFKSKSNKISPFFSIDTGFPKNNDSD